MNALTKQDDGMPVHVAPKPAFSLAPQNLDQAFKLADMLADSELVPKDFRNKPGNCLIAIQWGSEIGLKPLQALQNIAVINGRPCLWGDALIALVRSSPLCEHVIETMDGDVAVCRVKRRGEPEQVRTFSSADAKTAGLLGKQGPWQTSPARMKQMRARAFALRDVFPDVLKGIAVAEEVMDYADIPSGGASLTPALPVLLPTWPSEAFAARIPKWSDALAAGQTHDAIAAFARSKGALTDDQEKMIRGLKPTVKQPEPEEPTWGDDSTPADTQGGPA